MINLRFTILESVVKESKINLGRSEK
jgi:hypothetical protein